MCFSSHRNFNQLGELQMLKKLLLAVATFIATMGFAFAQVDVNKADQAALDGVKGIGPKLSKTIIDERKKNGDFKDWTDFETRVKGVGEKNAAKLSANGLTVNGQPLSGAPAASAGAKSDKKAKAADTSTDAKPAAMAGKDSKAKESKESKPSSKKDESKKDEAKK
jgi:competence protein ComEA